MSAQRLVCILDLLQLEIQKEIRGGARWFAERTITMNESELKELIMRRQVDGKISCKVAFDIADEAGASKREVGELLNEMQIKVRACQLGCFK